MGIVEIKRANRQNESIPSNGTVRITARTRAHTHTHAHTHLSSTLRPVNCYLASISEVCPNSAVVVPEEFPRGKFGKQVGKEVGRPKVPAHPLPSH